MPERLGPYEVLQSERRDDYLSVARAASPAGEQGRLYWFDVKNPEARAAFFRFRKALKALSGLGVLPEGLEISAKPRRYYVFWPLFEAPSALPAKGRKVMREVGAVLETLRPLGYALPDLDLRLGEEGVRVAALDPLAEHDELEVERLGGRFLKARPSGRVRRPREVQAWAPGLILLVLGIWLLAAGSARYLNPPEFIVPELTGKDPRSALEEVRDMGLKVVFTLASEPEQPRDLILEQNPPPGTRVKPGRSLELVLNRPKDGSVPRLEGLPLPQAQRTLEEAGYLPGPAASGYSEVPEGIVLASAPPAQAPLPQGEPVRLLTSSGSAPRKTVLPDLTGLTLEEARYLLSVAELRLGEVQTLPAPQPEGTVLAQSPPGGVELDVGSPVVLTVAGNAEVLLPEQGFMPPPAPETLPEEPAGPSPTVPPADPAPGERIVPIRVPLPTQGTGKPVHVRLVVSDENGERTPIDTFAQGGSTLEGSVRVKGDAKFQLFLDGFPYQQWTSRAP
ncbi:MAG TPA: PASTA domain-containing protein [Oceanithermus profundus]|uniref:PASTA domain-containing protein n=1 Tax=Oceanithermus profundus TaxID=187137 RepID=A0A7C4VBI6_9DEIN|nr:PASTA domain-containing protein [Oceanithermus profundus]